MKGLLWLCVFAGLWLGVPAPNDEFPQPIVSKTDPTDGAKGWACKKHEYTFNGATIATIYDVPDYQECCTRCYLQTKRFDKDPLESECRSWVFVEADPDRECPSKCILKKSSVNGNPNLLMPAPGHIYGENIYEALRRDQADEFDFVQEKVLMCDTNVFDDYCLCNPDCTFDELCGDCGQLRPGVGQSGCTNELVQHCVCENQPQCCTSPGSGWLAACIEQAYLCGLPDFCKGCQYYEGNCPDGTSCSEHPTTGHTICT